MKNCPAIHKTIAAGEIEPLVLQHVRHLLRDPNIVASAVNQLQHKGVAEDSVIEVFKNMHIMWDMIFPVEQQRICQMLIEKVILSEENVQITLRKDAACTIMAYLQ